MNKVVVVVEDFLDLFEREFQDNASDLTGILFTHIPLNVLINEVANYVLNVLVVGCDYRDETKTFKVVSVNLRIQIC